jgi:addiction module RelB/DinJ family antitoxin
MTVLFRCRIEKPVLKKAERVAKRLGTSTSEMVRIFVTQMARTGGVPLNLNANAKAKANGSDAILAPWDERAARLESFYDPTKTW